MEFVNPPPPNHPTRVKSLAVCQPQSLKDSGQLTSTLCAIRSSVSSVHHEMEELHYNRSLAQHRLADNRRRWFDTGFLFSEIVVRIPIS
jgi:hypothetical protein